jgi:hypothetical protein
MFSYRLVDLKSLSINPEMPLLYELDVAIQPVRIFTAESAAGEAAAAASVEDEFASRQEPNLRGRDLQVLR